MKKGFLFLTLSLFCNLFIQAQDAAFYYTKGKEIILSRPDSAFSLFEKAVEFSRKEKNDSLLGLSLHEFGKTCYETSKYVKATESFAEAETIFEKLKRDADLAELDLSRGRLFVKLSDFDQGSKYFVSAQRRFTLLNDYSGQLRAENNIGVMYFEKGDLKRAQSIFFELQKKTPAGDRSQVDLFGNLAIMFFYTEQLDSALLYFRRSLQEHKLNGNTDGVAVNYNNIGHVFNKKGQYDSAMVSFNRSLDLYSSVNNHAGVCLALGGKAQVFHKRKMFDQAIELYRQSFSISQNLGLKFFAENTSLRMANLEAERGNYENAFSLLKTHLSYRDSTQNEKSDRLVEEMQARFSMEKKEAQIDSLRQQQELSDLKIIAQQEEADKKSYLVNGMLIISLLILIMGGVMYSAYRNKRKSNQLLTIRNMEIAQQNKEIKDSIRYAKHIQEAILPPNELIESVFPDSFVFYQPKDIVSGDFYWLEETENQILFATVDCTGHGVPGAFMSIVAFNGLIQAVNVQKLRKPSEILDFLTLHVNTILRQNQENSTVRDGMDITLCALNKKTYTLEYSGANNPLLIGKSNGELLEIAADKQPVGNFSGVNVRPFTNHTLQLEKGDEIFLFSDGFCDQFGGENVQGRHSGGKKFKYSRFKNKIQSILALSPKEQMMVLQSEFELWKGDLEQLDDVCIMGVKL